jgi:hypothetical protein
MYYIRYSWGILMKLEISGQIFKKAEIPNFMKFCPVGAELLHEDERMDRHDKTNNRFSQFFKSA